jgi:23S rRNA (adenine2503-C2)-methyltransferase
VDKDLKSKTLPELEGLVVEMGPASPDSRPASRGGQKKYLAGYIFGFIHTRSAADLAAITPLSKSFRSRLTEQGYYISALQVIEKLTDPDGTVKYVFGLPDGNKVESVLLFDDDRRTLCVSTQAGCAMGCVFCATGRLGLKRNLTTAEIVDQVNIVGGDPPCPTRVRRVEADARISNVVFMGMGEPLVNYEAVLDAVRILNHPEGRKIGIRHIAISTCGLPEEIERLADEDIQPRLAISLNAPTDAIRQKLMPIAKRYPLDRLFQAVRLYQRKTRNRVTFEYCMIKGVNDTVLHARLLVKRLHPFNCNVNLIEYNPHAGCKLKPSDREAIERFAKVLKDSGIETTVRLKMGQTINAACGQLGAQNSV